MSLQEAIDDLCGAAKRLDKATFNPQMDALQKFVDKLDGKALSSAPPEDVRQKTLEKFLRGEDDFTRRERRALPFIIYEPTITLEGVKKIFRELNFLKSSHLLRIVSVYLQHYDNSAKTEFLRRRLMFVPKELAGNSTRLKKIFSARDFLFGENRFDNMTKLLAESRSVNVVLKALGLSNFFKVSNFIQAVPVRFFRMSDLDAQLELLDELDAEYDAYQKIFPAIADALIQTVDRAGFGKENCLNVFYRRLGDPRFGGSRFNWQRVSDKSKEIFCHWLSEDDLETFFKIVAATSNDKQWSYRERFWRRYLPRITNTWIFLTGDAKQYAARSNVRHGTLTNGGGNQAVFVFQVGRYIFSEWSNVGKVRAYDSSWREFFFGRKNISGNFIRKNFVAEWIHLSPSTYFWQDKVDAWIRRHC